MNATRALLIAAPLAALSIVATAQEATPDRWTTLDTPRSRAEVVAERAVPRPGGRMADYYFSDLARSTKTRAQVAEELQEARRNGEFAAMQGEAYVPVIGTAKAPLLVAGER